MGDMVVRGAFIHEWQLSPQVWSHETIKTDQFTSLVLKTLAIVCKSFIQEISSFFPCYSPSHKKENTLICKLRGPLPDNWFMLKTLNTVRRKQFLLFPQLGIWTHSRHFSLNRAQASPSVVLAHWWEHLLHKSSIFSPRHQQTSLSERSLNKKPSIFSSFSGKVKFSFSLQYRSNVIRICFDIISSAKSHLLQSEFTNLAVLPKIGGCHLVPLSHACWSSPWSVYPLTLR